DACARDRPRHRLHFRPHPGGNRRDLERQHPGGRLRADGCDCLDGLYARDGVDLDRAGNERLTTARIIGSITKACGAKTAARMRRSRAAAYVVIVPPNERPAAPIRAASTSARAMR